MMTIAFSCRRCLTRFAVPDSVAGKKARCKKCGNHLQVPEAPPTAAAVAASGLFRMGAVQADQLPDQQSPSSSGGRSKRPASLQLAPIASLDEVQPIAERKSTGWEEEESVEYELERRVDSPVITPPRLRQSSRGWTLRGRGSIGEKLLVGLRKVSDVAYSISILLLLVLLLAIIIKSRELAITAAVVIILLNIGRLCLDGFVLVTLAFKNGPLQGVLFFIPPFTFYYLRERGAVMKEALRRFLGPALPIVAVVLLFVFVPWLQGEGEGSTGREQIRNALEVAEEAVRTNVSQQPDAENQ